MYIPQNDDLHIRQSAGLGGSAARAGGDETGTRFIIGFSVAVPLSLLIGLWCWYYQRRKRGLQFIPRRWKRDRNTSRKTGKKSMAQVKKERAEEEARREATGDDLSDSNGNQEIRESRETEDSVESEGVADGKPSPERVGNGPPQP